MHSISSILKNTFGGCKSSSSDQYQINCPRCARIHNFGKPDNKYNLEINTTLKVFHCWKCEFKGSLSFLIRRYSKSIDVETFEELYFDYDIFDDKKIDKNYFDFIELPKEFIPLNEYNRYDIEHLQAYKYATLTRNLSKELIKLFNIGFCVEGKYKGRIILPSYDKYGNLNYFTTRAFQPNILPKYLNPEINKNKIIFNEKNVNWNFTVYLVEGSFDLLSLPVNTIPLLGKEMNLTLLEEILFYKPNIILILDADAIKESLEIYDMLSIYDMEKNIKYLPLPQNYDIDKMKKEYGHDKMVKYLLNSVKSFEEIDYLYNEFI